MFDFYNYYFSIRVNPTSLNYFEVLSDANILKSTLKQNPLFSYDIDKYHDNYLVFKETINEYNNLYG